ncbi:TonB-dependent receptor [Cyclobacterium marinum]|uniref:TonB-dependent receptor plug n=1 Tax=Cyclobacterium marinum (strain ATCC 25205 / DSM 745 / LMG 13164 / NCIMB 1802) TaxID=880070 RepID=G0J1I5_CYCMS|nr:TonB-dependent receptor [Cyclobacterium marinum]AEL27380.1 TonB-dependent receptor plug [Cyclobacterium marinum DSM 745]
MKKTLHALCMIGKYYLYGIVLQLLFINLLYAAPINAQGSLDMKEVYLSISLKEASLPEVFSEIKSKTDFSFIYDKKVFNKTRAVNIKANGQSLESILVDLAKAHGLRFKQVDDKISVRLVEEKESPPIIIADVTVTGTVVDSEGNPIPGVTVSVPGTSIGTATDLDGKYSLTVPEESTLIYSFIGFESQEREVGDQSIINITLEEDMSSLDEVVVIGFGTQKRVNVTGAISTVDMDQLENAPVTNSSQLLQGVQGVYVNQAGGQPGRDGATIRIRGQGTLNNNNALVLVNGIEFPLSEVNPNDIESISVLKDAASAAIYGSRAANGVILVTTKSGSKDKFQLRYNMYAGFQKVNYLPDVIKDPVQFMELRNQAMINGGRLIVDYPQTMIDEYREGMKTDPYTYPNNDWFDIMFNAAPIQEHNLQFSGGSENLTYSLSLGYLNQEGVMMGSGSDRYSLAFNSTAQISKRLKIGTNINAIYRNIDEPVAGVQNLMGSILKAQAFHPTYLEDGRYANTFVRSTGHNIFRHPIVLATEGENQTTQQRYLINLFAEYELPFDITYKVNIGVNKSDDFNTTFVPDIFIYQNKTDAATRVPFNGDAMSVSQQNRGTRKTYTGNINTTVFNTLNWSHDFNETHHINSLLGISSESFSNNVFWGQNEGFLGNDLYELNAGSSNPAVSSTSASSRLNSYFGRIGYNFKEKYLFEANFRYDGSSRFAKDSRWGLFPSFSAGWRLDRENFLANIPWISDLKLRASWGRLGIERIGLFRYLNLINLGQDYAFGTNISAGAAVTSYNDPNITWETTTISNVGVDAGFFENRVGLEVDIFKKRTTDILRAVNLPSQVGNLNGPIQNIGTVDNTGFELGLNYRNNFNDFNYQINGSVTRIINEVIDLKGQTIYNGRNIITEGQSIDSYYLIHAIGIFQSQEEIDNSPFQTADTKPGYLKYQDTNEDGFITEDDRIISGSVIPEYTYQFSLNLGYKGFEVNAFFQGVANINTYASLIAAQPFWFGTAVTKEWTTDAWTPENTDARLPILTTFESSVNENFRPSDFWLRDASYLRMKNLQIGYNIPSVFTSKYGVSNLKVYLNGQNLLTFSKMKDFDPEKNINGVNFYEYPTVKMYTAGLNVTF